MASSYSYSVILEPQEGGGFTVLVPAWLPKGKTNKRLSPTPRKPFVPSLSIDKNRA